jgi:hypothetical protein
LHVCVCALAFAMASEAIWDVLFYIDFPISWVVFVFLGWTFNPHYALCLLGTIWWYFLSDYIRQLYGWIKLHRRKRSVA